MIIDPVCGLELDDFEYPESEEYNGRIYFFGGLECAQKFRQDPEKYTKGREYLGEPIPGYAKEEEKQD